MVGATDTNPNRLPPVGSKLDKATANTAARTGPLPAIGIACRNTRLTGIETRLDRDLDEGLERHHHARPSRFAFQREGRRVGSLWLMKWNRASALHSLARLPVMIDASVWCGD